MYEDSDEIGITEEWERERLGKFTSSQIAKLLVGSKKAGEIFGEGAITHIYKKVGEIITQEKNDVSSAAIKWGEEHEEDAFLTFCKMFDSMEGAHYYGKKNPLFVPYIPEGEEDNPDFLPYAGGSPDFELIDAIGEIKCPFESGYHMEVFHKIKKGTFNLKEYDKDYYGQVQFNMYLKKKKKAVFVSYDPRVIDWKLCCTFAVIEYDEAYIADLLPRIQKAEERKNEFLTDLGFFEDQQKEAA